MQDAFKRAPPLAEEIAEPAVQVGVIVRRVVLRPQERMVRTGDTETTIFAAQPGRIEIGDEAADADEGEFTLIEKFLLGISREVQGPNRYPTTTAEPVLVARLVPVRGESPRHASVGRSAGAGLRWP